MATPAALVEQTHYTEGRRIGGSKRCIAAARPFEEWYQHLQDAFLHVQLTPTDETCLLVDGRTNAHAPIHRWYSLKESFAPALPIWLCRWMHQRYHHQPSHLCEPFLGSGTTAVTLAPHGISITGIEYNPFIRFVAATKAAIPLMSSRALEHTIVQLETKEPPTKARLVPELSTLHNTQYSDAQTIQLLLSVYQCINNLDTSPAIRSALHLGLAATIEAVFHLRKDGRALRYVPKPIIPPVRQILSRHWRTILADVQAYESSPSPLSRAQPSFAVYGGSATNLQTLCTMDGDECCLAPNTFDTMIYSPPYVNNFDYSEVYKLELWLLHFIENYDAWKELRLGTIRSHHSLVFPETQYLGTDPRTQAIAKQLRVMGMSICLPDEERERVRRVINGYFDDMYLALCEQWRVLKPGGIISYIVVNSSPLLSPSCYGCDPQ